MIKKILFIFLPLFFLFPFSLVKAEEQFYSIDVMSFTYGGYMGDLNTGCTFQTRTQSLSSNFSQYFTLTGGGYCSTEPSGMTFGLNITTDMKADTYYTITEELHFSGSIYYLQSAINVYTQCGVYTSSGWNMSACENISVTATSVTNGYASIKVTFKPKVNGTKFTFTVGSLAEGYKMFYVDENSQGSFKLNNLIVDKLTSSSEEGNIDLGPIINQNQTIINQNNQTNQNLEDINGSITSDNVDDFSDTINSFEDFLQENSTITKLITLPVTLYSSILNNIDSTCSPFNLGSLYGEPLILPCINIGNYLGSTLWGMIDLIISGFSIYAISKKFIKIFNNFSTLKEGDILDD